MILNRGVSRRSQTGGPSESLLFAPWSKVEELRPHSPPPAVAVNLAPLKVFVFPGALPGGAPLLVLERRPLRHVDYLFSFFFPFFPSFSSLFSLSFSFFFFFGAPLVTRGAEVPKGPPGYAHAKSSSRVKQHV